MSSSNWDERLRKGSKMFRSVRDVQFKVLLPLCFAFAMLVCPGVAAASDYGTNTTSYSLYGVYGSLVNSVTGQSGYAEGHASMISKVDVGKESLRVDAYLYGGLTGNDLVDTSVGYNSLKIATANTAYSGNMMYMIARQIAIPNVYIGGKGWMSAGASNSVSAAADRLKLDNFVECTDAITAIGVNGMRGYLNPSDLKWIDQLTPEMVDALFRSGSDCHIINVYSDAMFSSVIDSYRINIDVN